MSAPRGDDAPDGSSTFGTLKRKVQEVFVVSAMHEVQGIEGVE